MPEDEVSTALRESVPLTLTPDRSSLAHEWNSVSAAAKLTIRRVAADKITPHLSLALIMAFASRETGMRNIVGDHGHGRGMWQQDDRWEFAFLRATRGCRSGSSIPIYPNAFATGRVPTISAGCRRMCVIVEGHISSAIRAGIPRGHRLHFAASAYNAGFNGALMGWREHRDPDWNTANGNYGEDVIRRFTILKAFV